MCLQGSNSHHSWTVPGFLARECAEEGLTSAIEKKKNKCSFLRYKVLQGCQRKFPSGQGSALTGG